MSKTGFIDFIFKRKGAFLTGVAVLVLVALLMLPGGSELGKLQTMLDKGRYEAAQKGASRAVAKHPESWEHRLLLAEVELALGHGAEALEQACVLEEMGRTDNEFLQRLKSKLFEIDNPAERTAVFATLEALLASCRWDWLDDLALDWLSDSREWDRAPGILCHLHLKNENSPRSLPLFKLLYRVLREGNIAQVWAIWSSLADEFWGWGGEPWPQHLLAEGGFPQEDWRSLQQRIPDDTLLAAACSQGMGEEGLEWLASWEQAHTVEAENKALYSALKATTVALASQVEPRHFQFMTDVDILRAAAMDAVNKDKLGFILGYVARTEQLAEDIECLELALALPKPALSLPLSGQSSWHLYGDWLGRWEYSDQNEGIHYVNLVTDAGFYLPMEMAGGYYPSHCWSPEGKYVALSLREELKIYNDQGEIVQRVRLSVEKMYWLDDCNLMVADGQGVYRLTVGESDWKQIELPPGAPDVHALHFGPGGRIAWRRLDKFYVYDGAKTETIDSGVVMDVQAWAPDGSAVLLTVLQNKKELADEHGSYDYEELMYCPLGGDPQTLILPNFHVPYYQDTLLAWVSEDVITWPFELPATGQQMLATYNLKTGEQRRTGIISPLIVSQGRVLAQGVHGLYIYELEPRR